MSKASESVKLWRKQTKSKLVQAFGGECGICKQSFKDELFDFHHLDKATKEFSLGGIRANCISWKRIVKEVKKCAMLCGNCHRLVHYYKEIIPEDAKKFNTEFEDYDNRLLSGKCQVCGDKTRAYNITCSKSCAAKLSGSVDWSKIDILYLYNKYKNYSKIADMLTISPASVRKRYLLESEKLICPICNGTKNYKAVTCSLKCSGKKNGKVDWENIDLIQLLIDNENNKSAVGRLLGVSENAVRKRLKKYS